MSGMQSIIVAAISVLLTIATATPALVQEDGPVETPSPLIYPELTPFTAPAPPLSANPDGTYKVYLEARLTEDGAPLQHGLHWRIFDQIPDANGKLPMLASAEGGRKLFEFEPGEYLVHVAFGLAGITGKLRVPVQSPEQQVFVLNAGGLVLNAVSGNDGRVPDTKLSFSIYTDERDENDDRPLVISKVKPNQIIRLNEGTYHVVSDYGNVNAVIRSDIRVEAGKLTEATIQHRAANLTLKLVAEEGGEAIADTAWSITNSAGDIISESVGAFPSLVLAEGQYTAIARHKEAFYRRDFQVIAGRDADVEVLLGR